MPLESVQKDGCLMICNHLYNRCNFVQNIGPNNSITKEKYLSTLQNFAGRINYLPRFLCKNNALPASVLKQLYIHTLICFYCHELPSKIWGSVIFPQLEGSSLLNWSQICNTSFSCILPISFSLKIIYSDLLKSENKAKWCKFLARTESNKINP